MVFTTRLAGGKGGRNGLEHELRRLGIRQKNGKPNHPQTQGKVERFQQTMKNWLRAQPGQPATLAELQALLDTFAGPTTPGARTAPSRAARPPPPPTPHGPRPARATAPPTPTTASAPTASTRPGSSPSATRGQLHHIGIGRAHAGTHVLLLVQDLNIRVINAATGELLRELTLNPERDYQPTGRPPGRTGVSYRLCK